jgi:putative peptidoglycan lipid II flippase
MAGGDVHHEEHAEIGRSAGKIGAATLVSHVFGLGRDILFAFLFGTSFLADAFNLAFAVPQFLRRLFGEGVMNAAFVPIYTQHRLARGEEGASRFGSNALVVLTILLLLLVGLAVLAARPLVALFARGWVDDPERMEAAVRFTRLLFPYLVFIGPAVLVMGILNALRHFTVPALSPVVWNVGIIAFGFAALALPSGGYGRMDLFCAGVLVGSVLQLAVQIPQLRKMGFRFRPVVDLRSPELRAVGKLMLPGVLGLAVVQINVLVDTFFATLLNEGSVTALRLGNRVMFLPLAVFATAVASASLPSLSAQVAGEGVARAKKTLGYTLRLLFFLLIPASVGLMVLRRPIIQILFVRGAFDAGESLNLTSNALLLYSFGLFAFGGVKGVSQVFFSMRDTKTPLLVGAIATATNVLLDWLLYRPLGVGGLALATSIAGMVNFFLLFSILERRHGSLGEDSVLESSMRTLLASLVMGAVAWIVEGSLEPTGGSPSMSAQLVHVGGSILAGIAAFAFAARLLCQREIAELRSAFFRRR